MPENSSLMRPAKAMRTSHPGLLQLLTSNKAFC